MPNDYVSCERGWKSSENYHKFCSSSQLNTAFCIFQLVVLVLWFVFTLTSPVSMVFICSWYKSFNKLTVHYLPSKQTKLTTSWWVEYLVAKKTYLSQELVETKTEVEKLHKNKHLKNAVSLLLLSTCISILNAITPSAILLVTLKWVLIVVFVIFYMYLLSWCIGCVFYACTKL